MELLGEVGPFTSSSEPTTNVGQASVEIDFTGAASPVRMAGASLSREGEKKEEGGGQREEGALRSVLRRLAEEDLE